MIILDESFDNVMNKNHNFFDILNRAYSIFSGLFHPNDLFEYALRILMKTIRRRSNSKRELEKSLYVFQNVLIFHSRSDDIVFV